MVQVLKVYMKNLDHGNSHLACMRDLPQVTQVFGVVFVLRLSTPVIVQELCESRGGRPGLSVLTSLLVSVDVKNY